MKVRMIIDGKPNAIDLQVRECRWMHIFAPYIEKLFALKVEGVCGAKELLNVLWGGLSEKNSTTYFSPAGCDPFIGHEGKIMTDISPGAAPGLSLVQKTLPSKRQFGRVSVFLVSLGRLVIGTVLQKHKKHQMSLGRYLLCDSDG